MVDVIPKQIKDVWDSWNIRIMVILSLSLQTTLIFFAPSRKRTPNKFLILLVWSSYLLADFSANFVVSLIAKNQGKVPNPFQDKELPALWAPFLLLHLGGPDTITAFSLEDNALWTRHFLELAFQALFQALAGVYVVVMSLPNALLVIILLIFVAGTFKYLERIIALYLASTDLFMGSMLQAPYLEDDYTEQTKNLDMDSRLISEMYMKEKSGQQKPLKLIFPERDEGLTDLEILQYAYFFFSNFKSFMANNIFSLELRDESKAFFRASKLRDEEALRIIEAELNFIYEGLYTKSVVLHSWVGVMSRFISLGSLLSAFGIFHYRKNKIQEFQKTDIVITYTLFLVGIALDVISILMLLISDWTAAILTKLEEDHQLKERILNWITSRKRPKWKTQTFHEEYQEEILNTPFLRRRWSGSISMFNLITYSMNADIENIHNLRSRTCWHLWKTIFFPFIYALSIIQTCSGNIATWFHDLHHQYVIHQVTTLPPGENLVARSVITIFNKFIEFLFHLPYVIMYLGACFINFFGIKDLLNEIRLIRSVHSEPLTKKLWSFIFSELKTKSQIQESPKNTKTKTSSRRSWASSDTLIQIADHEMLLRYIDDVDYDHSLLIWHIATEFCYQEEASAKEKSSTCEYHSNRKMSKILSDYMMYLLIKQPKLMSEVAGIGKMRFRDTLGEAERFFKKKAS